MKTKLIILGLALSSILFTNPLQAETEEKPFLGILISSPLPELLTKHLLLEPEQGIAVTNVCLNSPADKAGIDRDDIIIELNGKKVMGHVEFTEDIRRAGIGSEVSVKLIHLGKRKELKIKLIQMPDNFPMEEVEWKYPHDPEMYNIWRPGRMYRLQPGDKDWTEIENLPEDMRDFMLDIEKFFNERHNFYHSENGECFCVDIEGDPLDEDTIVTVRSKGNEHSVAIKNIDELPKKYQKTVRKDIEEAKKSSKDPSVIRPQDRFFKKKFFKDIQPPVPNITPIIPDSDSKEMNERLREMQKQLDKMRENMRQMEERMKEFRPEKSKEPQDFDIQNDDHV